MKALLRLGALLAVVFVLLTLVPSQLAPVHAQSDIVCNLYTYCPWGGEVAGFLCPDSGIGRSVSCCNDDPNENPAVGQYQCLINSDLSCESDHMSCHQFNQCDGTQIIDLYFCE